MWRLFDEKTGRELGIGDNVKTFRGEQVTITGLRPPHKPASTGHVTVKFADDSEGESEFYAGVIGARFDRN